MSPEHRAILIQEIVELFTSDRYVRRDVNPDSELAKWAQSLSGTVDSYEASHIAFEAIVRAVSQKDELALPRKPLTAAFHLLALGNYPARDDEVIEDTGRTLRQVRETAYTTITGMNPREILGLRQQIAVLAGHYGTDRSTLARKKSAIRSIASEVLDATEVVIVTQLAELPKYENKWLKHLTYVPTATEEPNSRPITPAIVPRFGLAALDVAHRIVGFVRAKASPHPFTAVTIVVVAALAAGGGALAVGLSKSGTASVHAPKAGDALCSNSDKRLPPFGWSPERNVYPEDGLADHATFNSVGINERYFMDVIGTDSFGEPNDKPVKVQIGRQYTLGISIRNGAAAKPTDNIASDSTLRINLPPCGGKFVAVWAYIKSSTTNPGTVAVGSLLVADKAFRVRYVPGSAILKRRREPHISELDDSLFSGTGAAISSDVSHPGEVGSQIGDNLYANVKIEIVAG